MPPADKAITFAQRAEADGFEAVWWPDHLMNWFPDSIWTEDITPLARYQHVHTHFDPLIMMGVVGSHTQRLRVGVVVTDLVRRNPAMAANEILTLDHVTRGRAILGLGSGERLNITPYGMAFDKPVSRLEEGLDVMRLLMTSDTPVDYDGEHFTLRKAALGLRPYGDRLPPIWLAAHGPRMLALTGRKGDGWLPTKMSVEEYARSLAAIREAAREAGRDPDAITPGMLGYVLVGPDEETVERMTQQPLTRMLCILLPSQVYRNLGLEPPLQASSGFHGFIPTTVDRAEAERIIAAIPPRVVRYYAFAGTPEQIVEEIAAYHARGLRHMVLWNITAFGDPSLAGYSFQALRDIRKALLAR